ncbi:MAG TPA: AMP-binding protein [Syntrophales bacterium]|nr:AMP-binding protein [Syntrophales bacterium]
MSQESIYAQKPWLKHYDPGVPATLEYPQIPYAELIRRAFDQVPDRTALCYLGQQIPYRDLDRLSNQLAHVLEKSGCRPGDTVGVHLPNVPACYIAAIAIQKAGCVFTGVSPLLTPEELAYQLQDSGARVLFTLDFFYDMVARVIGETGVRAVFVTGLNDFLPQAETAAPLAPIPGVAAARLLEALADAPADPVQVRVDPGDPCLMMYTGGTTGQPKGAVLTHNNIVHQILQLNTWMRCVMGEQTILCAFPLFHQAGNIITLWSLAVGSTLPLVPNPRDLDFIIASIKDHRPTAIYNVPTLFLELLKRPDFRALDFSGVQYFGSGASPFPAESIKELEALVGAGKLIEVYGMTETSPMLTALPRDGVKKAGSVGIPLPDTEIRLVDPDTNREVPIGEPGEFVARGPQVFTRGYHNKPEDTAFTLRNGWIHTGDIAVMDEDGYLFIVDRLKDMVSVSGFKVFTRQVDEVLLQHPDIDNAATIGLPDPKRPGSEIVACGVILKPGREKGDAMRENILAYMKEKVAPYKVPKVIRFLDQLPMSAVGKILKKDMRKVLLEEGA